MPYKDHAKQLAYLRARRERNALSRDGWAGRITSSCQ
jgi:hypothetical protein